MKTSVEWIAAVQSGELDNALARLYSSDGVENARRRALGVLEAFQTAFDPAADAMLFSASGRTEIGGNHTDHQHGRVLCGSVDMDMLACAAPNGLKVIRVHSSGYAPVQVELDSLLPQAEEVNTTAALIRGVAARITELGYPVGGFDVTMTSDVLPGSGLSSSAAFEVLMGNIINRFFCGGALDAIEIAKIGQYAENIYFGKPCGLMDQMACSVGGVVSIDFTNPLSPSVCRVDCDLDRFGYALCIVDTGSCHADLTDDYADITREMGAVAAYFDAQVLRDVPEADFRDTIPTLRETCGDRAVLRAMHFYEDDRRAAQEADALDAGDFDRFLALVNASGLSSELKLQNAWSVGAPTQQAIPLALAEGRRLLNGSGAIRVHGGGFAGTIQAFVPYDRLTAFVSGMEQLLGSGKCHVLRIRPQGGCAIGN